MIQRENHARGEFPCPNRQRTSGLFVVFWVRRKSTIAMAKTMWMRPNVVALCAFQAHFFSTRALLPWFQATKPARLVLTSSEKISWIRCGGYGGSKLDRRWSHSIRATTQVNDSGSIDSPLIQSMEKKIKEHLNADSVLVKDAYGDGRHVSIDVISSAFEGQSAVSRQRMVYKAIWEELQNTVHAVDQMTTKTPAEVASAK